MISDLSFVRAGFIITLTKSKTERKQEDYEIAIPYGPTPTTCPLRALQDWISLADIQEGPLFRETLINYRLADVVRIFDSAKFGEER
ncbi:MAG: hypothetical protein S4CHLAM81_04640 [Chlamydiales bacterium]|nr:hypothetical protein [Chlamydiales bacterium]MCH9635253.1 hypothetical protein [Chlamydiales bacterium]